MSLPKSRTVHGSTGSPRTANLRTNLPWFVLSHSRHTELDSVSTHLVFMDSVP